jgi:hypothetical protein
MDFFAVDFFFVDTAFFFTAALRDDFDRADRLAFDDFPFTAFTVAQRTREFLFLATRARCAFVQRIVRGLVQPA